MYNLGKVSPEEAVEVPWEREGSRLFTLNTLGFSNFGDKNRDIFIFIQIHYNTVTLGWERGGWLRWCWLGSKPQWLTRHWVECHASRALHSCHLYTHFLCFFLTTHHLWCLFLYIMPKKNKLLRHLMECNRRMNEKGWE